MRAHKAIRAGARLLMGSTFVVLGYDAYREPGGRVDTAAPTLATMRGVLPLLPDDDTMLVRANGAVQAACGALLALSILPRCAAATIAASLVPTTIAGHPFWSVDDPADRKRQSVQFRKNLAMLGGLLLAATD